MMLYLTLSNLPPMGQIQPLGTVRLERVRFDAKTRTGTWEARSQGQMLAVIDGWQEEGGPWRLAQELLDRIYGGARCQINTQFKSDGYCNGITQRGKRCRSEARPGRFYCWAHDPI